MTLRNQLKELIAKYGGNGYREDPFFNEVCSAVAEVREKKVEEKKIFYDYEAKIWKLTDSYIAFLQDDFDGLDVMAELRKMKAWLDCHPKKKDFKRFIVGWLGRNQQRSTTFAKRKR